MVQKVSAADAQKTEAFVRFEQLGEACDGLARESHESVSRVLGYMRGDAAKDDVTKTRAEFAEFYEDALRIATADRDDEHSALIGQIEALRAEEDTLFLVSTPAGERYVWDVLDESRATHDAMLVKNAKHRVRAEGYMAAFGNETTNHTMCARASRGDASA